MTNEFLHIISVYHTVQEKNSIGQIKEAQVKYADFYASVYQWQNRENYEANNLMTSDITLFRIYYDPNIINGDIIKYEDKEYVIKGIKNIGYREFLELTAQHKSNR